MLQIPTKTKPAYNAGNILTLNQKSQCLASPVAPASTALHSFVTSSRSGPESPDRAWSGSSRGCGLPLGWNVSNLQCDIDLSAYLLMFRAKFQVMTGSFLDELQPETKRHCISMSPLLTVNMQTLIFELDPSIAKIVLVPMINEALERNLNFSMVPGHIRILNRIPVRKSTVFMLTDYYDNVTSMMLGEIYLHNTNGNSMPSETESPEIFAGLCQLYGVETN